MQTVLTDLLFGFTEQLLALHPDLSAVRCLQKIQTPQQRVAIARALAMNPEVLCFDEPTSALDPELTGEVLRVIRELKDTHSTMIVVTHEMEFAKSVADVVIYMADGVIEEMGPPEQVFENPQSEKTRAFLQTSLEPF